MLILMMNNHLIYIQQILMKSIKYLMGIYVKILINVINKQ